MVVQEEEEDDIEAIEGHSSLFYYVTEDESSPWPPLSILHLAFWYDDNDEEINDRF